MREIEMPSGVEVAALFDDPKFCDYWRRVETTAREQGAFAPFLAERARAEVENGKPVAICAALFALRELIRGDDNEADNEADKEAQGAEMCQQIAGVSTW